VIAPGSLCLTRLMLHAPFNLHINQVDGTRIGSHLGWYVPVNDPFLVIASIKSHGDATKFLYVLCERGAGWIVDHKIEYI